MPPNQIEIILSRQLADSLSIPIFIVDPKGDLLFYNEPAEAILGKRYQETGKMAMEDWSTIFKQVDKDGNPIPREELPLVKTFLHKSPHHNSFWIESLSGVRTHISVTAYPIIGRSKKFLGAVAIFWKNEQ